MHAGPTHAALLNISPVWRAHRVQTNGRHGWPRCAVTAPAGHPAFPTFLERSFSFSASTVSCSTARVGSFVGSLTCTSGIQCKASRSDLSPAAPLMTGSGAGRLGLLCVPDFFPAFACRAARMDAASFDIMPPASSPSSSSSSSVLKSHRSSAGWLDLGAGAGFGAGEGACSAATVLDGCVRAGLAGVLALILPGTAVVSGAAAFGTTGSSAGGVSAVLCGCSCVCGGWLDEMGSVWSVCASGWLWLTPPSSAALPDKTALGGKPNLPATGLAAGGWDVLGWSSASA